MVMVPFGTSALPVGFRLAGRAIQTIQMGAAQGAPAAGIGGLLGSIGRVGKGTIITTLLLLIGGNAIEDLIGDIAHMFGGDETEAQKVVAILSAIEDAYDSGAILVPEPPRGYTGTIYKERLNYFHANMNDGKLWVSDFSNGKNHW